MSAGSDHAGSVGVVIALPAEARSVGARGVRVGECKRWHDGWVALSGIGPHNAMHAATQLVSRDVTALANWGVAGALDPNLEPGDIVVPDCILYSMDDTGYVPDAGIAERLASILGGRLRVRRGILWSTYEAIASGDAKRELAARSHAIAIDMEAAPVAAVARRHALPFVAVKAICDTTDYDLPNSIADTLQQSEGGVSARMLGAIALGGPRTWTATRKLASDFARARRALAVAAGIVDPTAYLP